MLKIEACNFCKFGQPSDEKYFIDCEILQDKMWVADVCNEFEWNEEGIDD